MQGGELRYDLRVMNDIGFNGPRSGFRRRQGRIWVDRSISSKIVYMTTGHGAPRVSGEHVAIMDVDARSRLKPVSPQARYEKNGSVWYVTTINRYSSVGYKAIGENSQAIGGVYAKFH